FLILALANSAPLDSSQLPAPANVLIDFPRDIQPILERSCLKCHSGEKPKGKFSLTTRESALRGGQDQVDIVPGVSAKSPLIHSVGRIVRDSEMPPPGKGNPLTEIEIGLPRAWIDQGAKWPEGLHLKRPSGINPPLAIDALPPAATKKIDF